MVGNKSKLNVLIVDSDFKELSIPVSVITTDLNTGQEVVINKGSVIDAIRSSISIPGIFIPVKTEESILVDGALVNPMPVDLVKEMGADYVIAVDLNHHVKRVPVKKRVKETGKGVPLPILSGEIPGSGERLGPDRKS